MTFAMHMAVHLGLVAVAAPLLAAWTAGGRLDPADRWPRGWLATAWWPLLASVLEFLVVWAWHAPVLHALARKQPAVMLHMTLLGVLFASAPRVLYDHGAAHGAAMALQDQQLGGVLMLAIGGVAYLGGALWLLRRLLRGQGRAAT